MILGRCTSVVARVNGCCSEHHSAHCNNIVGAIGHIIVAGVISVVRMRLCTTDEILLEFTDLGHWQYCHS